MNIMQRKYARAWDLSMKSILHLESIDDKACNALPIVMRATARRNVKAVPGSGVTFVYISAEDNDRIRERFHTNAAEELLEEPFADFMVFQLNEHPDINWRVSKFHYYEVNGVPEHGVDISNGLRDIFDRIDPSREPIIVVIEDLADFMGELGYTDNLRNKGHELVEAFHNDTGIPVITASRVPKHPLYYGAPFLRESVIVQESNIINEPERGHFTFLW